WQIGSEAHFLCQPRRALSVTSPSEKVGIVRKNQAQARIILKLLRDQIHHRITATNQILPQKLSPILAKFSGEVRSLLGVKVANQLILFAQPRVVCDKRSNV